MANNNFFKRVTSTFTLAAYMTTAFLAPAGNAAGFYRPQMQEIAGLYNQAAEQATEKQDIKVFTDAFGSDLLSEEDSAFVAKALSANDMPRVSVDKAVFVVQARGSDSVRIQPIDMDKGLFKINGLAFTWDDKLSLEENVSRIQPLAASKGFTLNRVWDLVIPSAHAAMDPKTVRTLAMVAGVAIIGLVFLKMNKNKLKIEEVKARLNAGQAANSSVLDNNKSGDPGYGYPAPSRPARRSRH